MSLGAKFQGSLLTLRNAWVLESDDVVDAVDVGTPELTSPASSRPVSLARTPLAAGPAGRGTPWRRSPVAFRL
jgi:hypothetical protein